MSTIAPGLSGNPNPYADAGPWGIVTIGGFRLPGIVLSIDGFEKPEDWNVQKGTGSSGATTVWKGTKLAESCKVELAAPALADFDGLYILRDVLRPTPGKKPPGLVIVSPVCNFNGITRIAQSIIGQPKWVREKNYWTISVTLIEYNPSKPTNTGTPAAPKWTDKVGNSGNDNAEAEFQKALNDAKQVS